MENRGAGPDNVMLAEGGLVISQTRLVSDGDTYAMASITSCRLRYSDETNQGIQFLMYCAWAASALIGIVVGFVIGGMAGLITGAVVAVIGLVAAFVFIHPGYQLYHVLVGTNTGDMNIVSTRDEDFARRVDRAINDAIIARG